ncbi:hypothetical protein DSL64_26940 [Dyadobacter luteus]|jgi:hypothetical protein|uniref:Uncharacterized protein n=1 Tax=Dyadobacter luteus TaxID=2259619 RepID=A0A3D8Y3C6_9BACT|nr:hypothetical protein [Dyadobacter luteus]REA56434.1 hypothetical protein DSL64_26940 [Dyadobacter luteus]
MTNKHHNLEWLDFIISLALNSSKSEVHPLTLKHHQTLLSKAQEEKARHISFLSHQSLNLSSKRKVQHLVKQQHSNLVSLLEKACGNIDSNGTAYSSAAQTMHAISEMIHDLLKFIERRFQDYIPLDETVPAAYLSVSKAELSQRIDIVQPMLVARVGNKTLTDIVFRSIGYPAADSERRPVTFKELFYKRELVKGIEKICDTETELRTHDSLIELLVYLNFNSRSFMNYYTQKLAQRINGSGSIREKLTQLLLFYKEFNQLHRKPGARMTRYDLDVDKVIGNWFAQEIIYLEKKSQWDVIPLPQAPVAPPPKEKTEPIKVMVLLSVDQIGIILRALDSLRILKAKSMNAVFQSITPFLSTPKTAEISWDSMRTKTYSFEEKDKVAVIKILNSVIDWIREY